MWFCKKQRQLGLGRPKEKDPTWYAYKMAERRLDKAIKNYYNNENVNWALNLKSQNVSELKPLWAMFRRTQRRYFNSHSLVE